MLLVATLIAKTVQSDTIEKKEEAKTTEGMVVSVYRFN
jgi:hypothetical protein